VLDSGDGVTHAVPVFEGFSMPHAIRRVDIAGRDVTDHLQLLLRKSGHHLHTTAEREVVRTIKEKCCYVASSPQKEEKDTAGRWEEYKLPDGNIVQVWDCEQDYVQGSSWKPSSVPNAFAHLKYSSTPNSLARSMLAYIKWLSTLFHGLI
jgi:hypothetical protein